MIEERFLHGRAHRNGTVVCTRVRATIRTNGSRRQVSVRFLGALDPALNDELERLLQACGYHGPRVAETLTPIDLDLRAPQGRQRLTGCRLGPPIRRFAPLREIDFRVLGQESQGTR